MSSVALLAGGTGGGKLAAGLQEVLGSGLAAIVNTADDVVMHGLHVSVDPDLVTYWLADAIDEERGWGLRDDGFAVHERLVKFGAPGWFGLSDLDLATSIYRTHFIAEGGTLTAAQAQIARARGPTRRAMRSRISPAALLVKVIARTSWGSTSPSPISRATRWVRTRVLPLPAPASTRSGPSPWSTASRCAGLSPSIVASVAGSVAVGVTGLPADREREACGG